ncbi:MAG: DUF1592 domain-containing protein, partial [Bdellovibrionota bacterium]
NPFACSAATIGVENIRRLSRTELENTLKNLLGPNIYANIADALGGLYQDTITKSVTDFSQQINDSQMNGYEAVADRILSTLTSKPNLVSDFGIACTSAAMTNACRDTIINTLSLKAYRRPITTTELKALQDNVFTLGTTTAEKIGFVLYRLVMSPDFLMRLEKGSGTTAASEFNLTPYEVASRISYMIGDSPPDDQLFAAAAAGLLQTEQQIQPHIDRLFAKPSAKAKIHNFFNYWLQPKSLSANGYATDFLAGLNIGLASPEYLREMDEFIDYIIFVRQGSLNDLLTSRDAFPRNSQAASVLGSRMLASNEQAPAQTDMNRIGLLMRPAVLATD